MDERSKWINACYEQYFDSLMARARCYAGGDALVRNELEDCVNEAFEIAWRNYEELRNHPCMIGWLTKTTYNRIDNFSTRGSTRIARRSVSIDSETTKDLEDREAARRLESWAEQEEHRALIERIIRMLTQSEKEIFDHYFIHGRTAPDIMEQTGYSLGRVRATIRRIRKKAKNVMGGEAGDF
ncbi:MAG: sigma-70 family RNA polymerase sigma factor [Clostridia bacterium]|nr:sigma-70 family RNA polymerase sigma factor [Clostridia bacterium]